MGGYSTSTTTIDKLAPIPYYDMSGNRITSKDINIRDRANQYLILAYREAKRWTGYDEFGNWVGNADFKDSQNRYYHQPVYDTTPTYAHITRRELDALAQYDMRYPHPDEYNNPQPTSVLTGGMSYRGRNGDQIIKDAIAYCDAVLKGNYLDGNAVTDFNTLLNDIAVLFNTDFTDLTNTDSFRYKVGGSLYYVGSPNSSANLARTLTAGTASKYRQRLEKLMYVDNWDSERQLQAHALGYGIDLSKQVVIDAELIRMSGYYYREWLHGDMENRYKLWFDEQTGKVRRLEIVGNAIRSLVGSVRTETSRYYKPSPIIGIAGGLLTAAIGIKQENPFLAAAGFLGAAGQF